MQKRFLKSKINFIRRFTKKEFSEILEKKKSNIFFKGEEFRKFEDLMHKRAYTVDDIQYINKNISPSFKKEIIKAEINTNQTPKFKITKILEDEEIEGDLDEVVINPTNFSLKNFIYECLFSKNVTKENFFFKQLFWFIKLLIIVKLFNLGYVWWVMEMDPIEENTVASKRKALELIFMEVEFDLKNKFKDVINDIK